MMDVIGNFYPAFEESINTFFRLLGHAFPFFYVLGSFFGLIWFLTKLHQQKEKIEDLEREKRLWEERR